MSGASRRNILNKSNAASFKANVRSTQIITTFGVGSIIDFPSESLMVQSIEDWYPHNFDTKKFQIHDERLAKKLGVKYFLPPPMFLNNFKNDSLQIPATLFPKWLFCKRCERIRHIKDWIKLREDNLNVGIKKCDSSSCNDQWLNPARFIVICERGHIDDFDWIGWAHREKGECGDPASLKLTNFGHYSGLSGLLIKCTNCGAQKNLSGILSARFNCKGYKPWENKVVGCRGNIARATHRGAGNVYFPITQSSIYIPPFTDNELIKIREHSLYNMITGADKAFSDELKNEIVSEIAEDIGLPFEVVLEKISSVVDVLKSEKDDIDYKYFEYKAFKSPAENNQLESDDFHIQVLDEKIPQIPYIKQITLVHRLREVRALTNFTRVVPSESEYDFEEEERIEPEPVPVSKNRSTPWKPAIEVRGEGIFLEISKEKLKAWTDIPDVEERLGNISSKLLEKDPGVAPAEYIMLHSLAHTLIRQFSFECGYSSSSLKERIYSSNRSGNEMSGILIYTAAGDSDGTLGGLVRLGKKGRLEKLFINALNSAKWCSSDPVCIETMKQGFQSLNLAACHACLLLPETCCERRNLYLDRALLVGTPENSKIGFFSSLLED